MYAPLVNSKSGWLTINKEVGMTSASVVNKIKKIMNVKKAGHAGTLDPLAAGMMVLAIGDATKFSKWIVSSNKAYEAEVVSIQNYGAFVKIAPGKEGLLHISQIRAERVEKVEDVLKVGQKITVKLMKIDDNNRLDFSIKALEKNQDS